MEGIVVQQHFAVKEKSGLKLKSFFKWKILTFVDPVILIII